MAHAIQLSSPITGIFGSISKFMANTVQSIANYNAYRVTLNELRALSSHNLADLGLNRSMIKRAALDAVFGQTR